MGATPKRREMGCGGGCFRGMGDLGCKLRRGHNLSGMGWRECDRFHAGDAKINRPAALTSRAHGYADYGFGLDVYQAQCTVGK